MWLVGVQINFTKIPKFLIFLMVSLKWFKYLAYLRLTEQAISEERFSSGVLHHYEHNAGMVQ